MMASELSSQEETKPSDSSVTEHKRWANESDNIEVGQSEQRSQSIDNGSLLTPTQISMKESANSTGFQSEMENKYNLIESKSPASMVGFPARQHSRTGSFLTVESQKDKDYLTGSDRSSLTESDNFVSAVVSEVELGLETSDNPVFTDGQMSPGQNLSHDEIYLVKRTPVLNHVAVAFENDIRTRKLEPQHKVVSENAISKQNSSSTTYIDPPRKLLNSVTANQIPSANGTLSQNSSLTAVPSILFLTENPEENRTSNKNTSLIQNEFDVKTTPNEARTQSPITITQAENTEPFINCDSYLIVPRVSKDRIHDASSQPKDMMIQVEKYRKSSSNSSLPGNTMPHIDHPTKDGIIPCSRFYSLTTHQLETSNNSTPSVNEGVDDNNYLSLPLAVSNPSRNASLIRGSKNPVNYLQSASNPSLSGRESAVINPFSLSTHSTAASSNLDEREDETRVSRYYKIMQKSLFISADRHQQNRKTMDRSQISSTVRKTGEGKDHNPLEAKTPVTNYPKLLRNRLSGAPESSAKEEVMSAGSASSLTGRFLKVSNRNVTSENKLLLSNRNSPAESLLSPSSSADQTEEETTGKRPPAGSPPSGSNTSSPEEQLAQTRSHHYSRKYQLFSMPSSGKGKPVSSQPKQTGSNYCPLIMPNKPGINISQKVITRRLLGKQLSASSNSDIPKNLP